VRIAATAALVVCGMRTLPAQSPGPAVQASGLTLEAVVVAALARHPLIEAARARVEAARGAARQVAAWPNPVGTYWLENAAFPGASSAGLDRESSAYATLPLESFYQRRPRVAQAAQDVAAARAAVETVRRQVAGEAARAFFRVAIAQAAVAAAEENRANLDQLVVFNEARVKEGAAPEGDLIRVRVEMDRATTDLVLAEVELTRARGDLWPFLDTGAITIGTPEALRVRPPAGDLRASGVPLADVLARARTARPEIAFARARIASAAAAVEYERALNVRQLGGTFGVKSTAGQRSMIAGVSLTVPLFDRNRGAVDRATAERLAAEQELAWAERTIQTEVQTSYAVAERLRARAAEVQHLVLERAESARAVALAAYREGASAILQVIDASRALADARLSYARLLLAEREGRFDLQLVSGTDPASVRIDDGGVR
jgi:cobalt-zinc-cadmium efflux system outer membrane protein